MALKGVAREDDIIKHSNGSTGKVVSVGAPNVFLEKKKIGVDGDTCSADGSKLIATTQTVFAQGKKVLRLSDKCSAGGVISVASTKVFAGD
jgi:uncharacterized Zn-binding protein involved in type VI secretion